MKKILSILVALFIATPILLTGNSNAAYDPFEDDPVTLTVKSDDETFIYKNYETIEVWDVNPFTQITIHFRDGRTQSHYSEYDLTVVIDKKFKAQIFFNNTILEEVELNNEGVAFYNQKNGGIEVRYGEDKMLYLEEMQKFLILNQHVPAPPTHRPAVSGKDSVINNIDTPYTLEQITSIANIIAIDEYDGDVSDSIEIVDENYTGNENIPGTYTITYLATNSVNLSTDYQLKVINRDLTKPVITGESKSQISYKDDFAKTDILNKYTVTDNYDEHVDLVIDSDDYVPNTPGTYTFNLSATDSSKNKATTVHTLVVVDDVPPVFNDTSSGVIQVNWRQPIDDMFLLLNLTAEDEIDGDLTKEITIITNEIKNKLGKYKVVYEVKDKSNNTATHERVYEIITTSAPNFFVSKNILDIEYVNTLSNDQLIDIIAAYDNIDVHSYEFIENEYEANANTPGHYNISVRILDTEGNIHEEKRTVHVFDIDELTPPKKLGFWKTIGRFFSNVWKVIVNIFVWIWKVIIVNIWKIIKWPFVKIIQLF